MHFLISSMIFFLAELPVLAISLFVVPFMLMSDWDGTTTWFGNLKYGRAPNHYAFPTSGVLWREWWFLCIRNPVSNFSTFVLSVRDEPWVWLYDTKILGSFHWKYGWKNLSDSNPEERTFVYRPWFHNEDRKI